jgi:hypothetical protein
VLRWPLLCIALLLMVALFEVMLLVLVRMNRFPVLALAELVGRERFLRAVLPLCFALAAGALAGKRGTGLPVPALAAGALLGGAALEGAARFYSYLYDFNAPAIWMFGAATLGGAVAQVGANRWHARWALAAAGACGLAAWVLLPPAENLHQAGVLLVHAALPFGAQLIGRS